MARLLICCGFAAAILCSQNAVAAERGHVSLSYQQFKTDGFESTIGELDIGTTDTQSLSFDLAYHLTERTTLHFGIPLVRRRYEGHVGHFPSNLLEGHDNDHSVDEGSYHTDFQDFLLGLSFLAVDRPVRVEPFLFYGLPSHDYPHFGHAAVGQNLWRIELGTRLTYTPPLSDFYFRFDPSYSFMEKVLGVRTNQWRAHAEVGYRFVDGASARMFVSVKDAEGAEFPDDFPPPRNTSRWYHHDRMVKHSFVNVGMGLDWQFSPRTQLSTSAMTMVTAEQAHVVKYAFNIGVTRFF
ncbi:MAG: hypothetical protein GKR90_10605 [Pseudomonadales bacterium]|nr:hypothetical protein [Pseudomonadales bacterium]